VYAYDLGRLLYKSAEVGFYIRVLGPIMPLIYLESIVIGILNGLNQQVSSLRYNVIDSVTRISMILAIVPLRGMQGFLFVMLVSNLLTSFLNLRRLLVVTKLRPDWTTLAVRPAFSIVAACALTVHTSRYFVKLGLLNPMSEALYGLAFMGAVYLFLLFITGCLKKSDLARAF
ncbi:MAG: polysaccharide biosynthesis C-terminal domain-containing protein, partial [Bacillota bacterium]|nr:polysaccharide biosynthesis C-terminal domain-containing protein [Bacillota bacterium]